MAIPKVCGIETEYGIQVMHGDPNPIAASSVLINAYAHDVARQQTGWDFEDEAPGNDARGFAREGAMPPQVETHLVNTVLTNGARFYVDHAHPEFSTPECRDALECLRYDRAGELILTRAMEAADLAVHDGSRVVIYKNNSDGKGNSYGAHENYLMDRAAPFTRIVAGITPHFVTRQIFAGAGKVGAETATHDGRRVDFQLSQRAEFFEEQVGLETTLKRPIVNTRDEPHADPQRYRRLHVIVGDANLAEVATFLKVGTTSLVLAMIEDDVSGSRNLALADPVRAIHEVALDRTFTSALPMADGTTATALGIQWELFSLARKYADDRGLECMGDEGIGEEVLQTLGVGAPRAGDRSDVAGPSTRLGGQTPADRGLSGPPPLRLGRPPAGRPRPPVPRSAAVAVAVRPAGHRAHDRRGCGGRRRLGTSAEHQGLVPGSVPQEVAVVGGHRQLGFARFRPGRGPVAACPYDGSSEGHGRARGGSVECVREPVRAVGSTEQLGN